MLRFTSIRVQEGDAWRRAAPVKGGGGSSVTRGKGPPPSGLAWAGMGHELGQLRGENAGKEKDRDGLGQNGFLGGNQQRNREAA